MGKKLLVITEISKMGKITSNYWNFKNGQKITSNYWNLKNG